MLLGVLVYGYATGVFSSRKLERATYDSVAFRFIAANDHPDHDTIAAFRRRFLKEIEALFVQVLLLAREMGVLQMGTIGPRRHENPRRGGPKRASEAAPSPGLAFTRATVAAVHTVAPAGVGKPSAVSFAASARSDREPSASSLAMIGASDAAWPAALSDRTLRP
jgi:hypothetical protein